MKGLNSFNSISVQLASSDLIRNLSYGEVKKPETINYRTLRPEKDGLFCERIFGPMKDYECVCGKFKSIRYKGIVCDKCGVEVTESKVRRYRTGHIELAAPVAHIWYYRIVPSKIALLLGVPPSDIQSILYFEKYIVVDPGETDLQAHQVLTDREYESYQERYKEAFSAGSGATAIKTILQNLDLDMLSDELRELFHSKSKTDKKVLRRLEFVEELRSSNNKPEWMILDAIPVIPPDLRPMVPLDAGRFATSDINELYRRLLNRNNRLKKLKKVSAPEIIIRNEMRMVQDAADSLFDNSRRSYPVTGNGDRPLKSLSDVLKGKQGRFRQNLLGKRVDYSGRSVIIVGPSLQMHQCGLPKQMALELFKPFVMNGLVSKGYAYNIKTAKRMVEMQHDFVWPILEEVVHEHPVLLNRAPTLHRLGIQAFEPVLIEEKAMRLHPLVCHAYNADFDGDQMAVHVPISPEAQIEAWLLMLSSRNLLNPANGKPLVNPSQDMVLGLYYLTKNKQDKPEHLKAYDSINELIFALDNKILEYSSWIHFKKQGVWYDTTPGRVLFNQIVPEKLGFINETVGDKKAEALLSQCYKIYGIKQTSYFADDLKNMGYSYATKVGASIGLNDVIIPDEKDAIVEKAAVRVQKIEENARKGLVTQEEKYNQVIDLWATANEKIKKLVEKKLLEDKQGFNSLYVMMDSGARGSKEQIRQLAGMRGLMAKPSGEIIELPILSNFKEGLTVLEYFISSHGARKGLADTALKTAEAGYLTRKLVDVAQDVVVNEHDCGTISGVTVTAYRQGDEIIKPLRDYLFGRTLALNVYDPKTGDIIAPRNTTVTAELAKEIEDAGVESVVLRSALTCESERGICAKCYGWDLSQYKLADIGEAVGIIAAESIGQPGTQLTMRTFHIGGTAATSLEDDHIKFKYPVYIKSLPENVVEKDGERIVSRKGTIELQKVMQIIKADEFVNPKELDLLDKKEFISDTVITTLANGEELRFGQRTITHKMGDELLVLEMRVQDYAIRSGSKVMVEEGKIISPNTAIVFFDPYNELFITEFNGIVGFYIEKSDKDKEGIEHSEILVIYNDENEELERFMIVPGTTLAVEKGQRVIPGSIIARRPMAKRRAADIIGGLPRIAELFESRKPRSVAEISKVAGVVTDIVQKKGKYIVSIKAHNGQLFTHVIPSGKNIYVRVGDKVAAEEILCDGTVSSHDILEVSGYIRVERFLLHEIQSVYRLQGVDINEKHISIIIRQMMKKVEIVDTGDTEFIVGQNVTKFLFLTENKNVVKQGGEAASAKPVLFGLTKASLYTDSFLSAASFQETSKILSGAALRSAVDKLSGLKDNLVVGQVVPAGTGVPYYKNIKLTIKE